MMENNIDKRQPYYVVHEKTNDDKHDPRVNYYTVYEINPDGDKFCGYAPLGNIGIIKDRPNLYIHGTKKLSKFAVKKARNAGMIFGEN